MSKAWVTFVAVIFKLLILPFVVSVLICGAVWYMLLRKRGLSRPHFWLSVISLGLGTGFLVFLGYYLLTANSIFKQIS